MAVAGWNPWFPSASDASCAHGVCPGARSGDAFPHLGKCLIASEDTAVPAVTHTGCAAKQLLGMGDSCSATFISHFTHLFSPPKYYMVLCLIIFSFAGKGDLQNISV